MTIRKALVDRTLTLSLAGRLDTTSAPELEKMLKTALTEIDTLLLDFAELEYLSSAGLRTLLLAQKTMNRTKGQMTVRHVRKEVLEVLEVTGFLHILTIE